MFGRGSRKARTAQAIDLQVDAATVIVETAPAAASSTGAVHRDVEMDSTFMAMMSQLDDSLAAMGRACDRIEQAVAGAGRHHPAGADTVAAA